MIQLKVGGKTKCFNLKDRGREKSLFETWYAMSDMPKYLGKHVKITTDKNEHFSYTIGEIEDCTFIEADYVESTPEKPPLIEELDKIFYSLPEKMKLPEDVDVEVLSVEEIYDRYFPISSDFAQEIRKIFCILFKGLSKKELDRMLNFVSQIRKQGYFIDTNDTGIQQILLDLITDPDQKDVSIFVSRFISYINHKKFC
jgi:hypothetical protein